MFGNGVKKQEARDKRQEARDKKQEFRNMKFQKGN